MRLSETPPLAFFKSCDLKQQKSIAKCWSYLLQEAKLAGKSVTVETTFGLAHGAASTFENFNMHTISHSKILDINTFLLLPFNSHFVAECILNIWILRQFLDRNLESSIAFECGRSMPR